jgi:hypothetical protein
MSKQNHLCQTASLVITLYLNLIVLSFSFGFVDIHFDFDFPFGADNEGHCRHFIIDDCDSLSKQQTEWPVQQAQCTELWRVQKVLT